MSLRARLLAGMAVVALVLVLAAGAIVRTTRSYLLDQVDAELLEAAARNPLQRPNEDRFNEDRPSPYFSGLVLPNGSLAIALSSLHTDAIPRISYARARDAMDGPVTVRSNEADVRYRIASRPSANGMIVVGLPLTNVDATIRRLIAVEVFATVFILGALGLVTWWVIRLGVRPIKQMTATAGAIAGGDLSARVPEVEPGTEAGDLGVALNQMLGRIEHAFDERTRSENRLRQFVADASHELRTPITTIRGYAELYRAGGLGDPSELEEAMRRTEQESVRMGTLVDDLLLLARLDQGRPLDRGPVDLTVIADDAVRDARAVDPQRPISATSNGPVTVIGDDARMRQVVANLLTNALVHTPPGTPIEVRVDRDGGRAVLEVSDEGPGMAPDVAARAFERFFRADPSRSRHAGGTGLGLAIVQATVAAHGGAVAIDTAPGKGTRVRVEIPISA
jgi:two-component system, OmpR family, sensor kinase